MSRASGRFQSLVALTIVIAAACATQTGETPGDDVEVVGTGGSGGGSNVGGALGSGGTEPVGSGGTGGGSGGSGATGGATASGGVGPTGAGGTSAGRAGSIGRGTGGRGETGGRGTGGTGGGAGRATGGAGRTTFGGAGMAATAGRSSGGRNAAGGSAGAGVSGGSAGRGGGGRTGAAGTGSAMGGSAGVPSNCITTLPVNTPTPELGKDGGCYDITANMMGWNVSNLGTRTLTVNGVVPVAPAPTPPPAVNGHRVFQFGTADGSQNQPLYTTFNYW